MYKRTISFKFIAIIFFFTIFLGFIGYREIRISHLRNEVEKAKGQKNNHSVRIYSNLIRPLAANS